MPDTPQNYQNHVRNHPPFHYVLTPLALINLIWSIVNLVRFPEASTIQGLLIAFLLVMIGVLARTNALKAQDRVIRLEEQLRYQRVLSPALAQRAASLTTGQVIALRFASDDELERLLQQTLDNKFANTKEIKQAIQSWRGDYLRV